MEALKIKCHICSDEVMAKEFDDLIQELTVMNDKIREFNKKWKMNLGEHLGTVNHIQAQ